MKKSLLIITLVMLSSNVFAQLKTSKLFTDHMVLQRDHNINVWGSHKKGKTITVVFNNETRKTKADKKGEWKVVFPAMQGGNKSYEMKISSGKEIISLTDIVVGDVWVCSGQSNMEWPLHSTNNAINEIAAANDSKIRHFKVPTSYAENPEKTLAGGAWEVASSNTVGDFTAVGYYFAKNIRDHHDIPIGLLNTSWGGSRIEPWMNAKTLKIDDTEAFLKDAQKGGSKSYNDMVENLKSIFPDVFEETKENNSESIDWSKSDIDESDWVSIKVPELWETQGFSNLDGVAWYRTAFELSDEESKNDVVLHLAKVDDSDFVWVNGNKIGETIQKYQEDRVYTIDSKYLNAGKNTIAVKVDDTGGGGGIYGEADDLFIKTSVKNILLDSAWKFKVVSYRKPSFGVNQIATLLYNKMVYPLLNFPIKGAIWYQGESNANSVEESKDYADLFPKMIAQWRDDWGQGNFPFLWVQLANYMEPKEPSVESSWAYLRESQSGTLSLPETVEAVIIDIGEAGDIHPRNKKDVGYRLSLGARKLSYNEDIIYSGPTYKNHEVSGGKIEISFNHIGSGLISTDRYGYVKGFTIAGADKKFVWAKATIKDDKVIVWSDEVVSPEFVRYAWANNPHDANLYNKENLPASPFRTDK